MFLVGYRAPTNDSCSAVIFHVAKRCCLLEVGCPCTEKSITNTGTDRANLTFVPVGNTSEYYIGRSHFLQETFTIIIMITLLLIIW